LANRNSGDALDGVKELILAIDVRRRTWSAYSGRSPDADDFYDGRPWEIGIRRFARRFSART